MTHPYSHVASRTLRGIRARRCSACRAEVVVGLDADWCAGVVTVDAVPLTVQGEALAILAGRRTYTLDGKPAQLTRRNADEIGAPKNRNTIDILATHKCADAIPEAWQAVSALPVATPVATRTPGTCPY